MDNKPYRAFDFLKKKHLFFFSLFLFCLLAFIEQYINYYHFFFVEQNQLFIYSWPLLKNILSQIGGFADVIRSFLTQFYLFPYAGAIITAGLITLIWFFIMRILRRTKACIHAYVPAFLPCLSLIILHSDFNYQTKGTIAFLMLVIILYGYTYIERFSSRLLYGIICIPVVFWCAGPISMLFPICLFFLEYTERMHRRFLLAGVLLSEAALCSFLGVHFCLIPTYRQAFLADFYYMEGVKAPASLYFSWITLVILFACIRLLRNRPFKRPVFAWGYSIFSVLLISGLSWQCILWSFDWGSAHYKKLDHHTKMQQWDMIIAHASKQNSDPIQTTYLNMALAHQGKLADKAFTFRQSGGDGLIVALRPNIITTTLLSDIYFTTGNIGMSQAMAFESCVINAHRNGSPRMLQRLVQTNLLFGFFPVAEKYLKILEKTLFYREWALRQYRFLYNNKEIESDPFLGNLRKNLLPGNHLSVSWDTFADLWAIIRHNPENSVAKEYVGIWDLLNKNANRFLHLLSHSYTMEKNDPLPKAFQEAALLFIEDTTALASYSIDKTISTRYENFKRFTNKNENSNRFVEELYKQYGDTYWFYFFIN